MRIARWMIVGGLPMALIACQHAEGDASRETPVAAAEPRATAVPRALAEVKVPSSALTVQVMEARRVTVDTVRVELTLIDTTPPASATQPSATQTPPAAMRPLPFSATDLCLLTPDGSRRLFVLRDTGDTPVIGGSFDPLTPGEHRVIWAMFPSPSPEATRISLQLGALVFRDLPLFPRAPGP